MEFYEILDEMEDMLHEAIKVPISGKVLVDPQRLLEKVDQLRAVLPEELGEARSLLEEQQSVFAKAEEVAQQIIEESKYEAARIVENTEITVRLGAYPKN